MLAATLSVLGDLHTTVGAWASADSLLSRALVIQRNNARLVSDRAATLERQGRLYRLTGRPRDAEPLLREALAIDRLQHGDAHPQTLRVQRELAALLRDDQRFGEAEVVLRNILSTIHADSMDSPLALETRSDLGYAAFQLGRFEEAVAVLEPTLERQQAVFGDLHVSTLYTTRALGSALRDLGRLDEAEVYYRNALRVSQSLYGEEHSETENATFVLGLVLERKRDLPGAAEAMRASLRLCERLFGSEHVRSQSRRMGLGSVLLEAGDRSGSERLLREVYRSAKARGNLGPDAGDLLNRLAFLLVERNAPDADRAYEDAVTYDNSRPSGQPDFVTDGLHYLAMAEHTRGDLDAAAIDFRRAVAVYDGHLPTGHPYRTAAAKGLASVERARQKRK
jgi:serine/threonine-protein kinase